MGTYTVKLKAPKGHEVPPLLSDLGDFVKRHKHGSLGWFDGMIAEPIPEDLAAKEQSARLKAAGFAFLQLPDGSLAALLRVANKRPVVLLGSDGELRTLADSLEEFLLGWAAGATGINELDDEEGTSRPELAAWLEKRHVKAAKSKSRFDFEVWLDGGEPAKPSGPAASAPSRRETARMKELGPKLRQAAQLVGLRADDPRVEAFVTKTLKKQLPHAASARNNSEWLEAPKAGLNLLFAYDVLNDAYPRLPLTKNTFVPYLAHLDVTEALGEDVLGVPWSASAEQVQAKLGKPTEMRALTMADDDFDIPTWTFVLDEGAEVQLELHFRRQVRVSVELRHALSLEEFPDAGLGVFVGWAASRELLDASRFRGHEKLLAGLRKRERQGSELVAAAMPRGLWDDHLVEAKGLRRFAYGYFHQMNDLLITDDLIKVFGKRVGPHGHDQPKLDDDSWAAVDKASKILDKRFAAWLRKGK